MIQVTRKDSKEALENLIRRFNRKVQQSGVLARAKSIQFFTKDISKRERRAQAIIRKNRKAEKVRRIRLGHQH
jgi:ribosomal protein S21